MRLLTSFALVVASLTLAVPALAGQTANDREAVRRAVLDYVKGLYEGDTAKLERPLDDHARALAVEVGPGFEAGGGLSSRTGEASFGI